MALVTQPQASLSCGPAVLLKPICKYSSSVWIFAGDKRVIRLNKMAASKTENWARLKPAKGA
jgi:hypothetical protein